MHAHRTAAILSIGDELTLGQTLDTNSRWLSSRLVDLGVMPRVHITIPDDRGAHARALAELARGHDLIISTGGLGPTEDDLTRHALADAMGEALVEDAGALETLRRQAKARGMELSAHRRLQALRPAGASIIANSNGTAPGLRARIGGCEVFCLPGPPNEMRPMFESSVAPVLEEWRKASGVAVTTRVLHTYGLAEADVAARLGEMMQRGRNPTVGTTASGGMVSVRMRHEGEGSAGAREIEACERAVRGLLSPHVFGEGDDTLAAVVVRALTERREKVMTIESCTGGGLASAITALPGSSAVFDTGLVTYANEIKTMLSAVPRETLEAHGAVSAETARAMAEGALGTMAGASAQHALSVTGIAGPGGATPLKPVGLVFIARASRAGRVVVGAVGGVGGVDVEVRRFQFTGTREDVRQRSVMSALAMLWFRINEERVGRLLWEIPIEWSVV